MKSVPFISRITLHSIGVTAESLAISGEPLPCQSPPTLEPVLVEPWVMNQGWPQSWTFYGSVHCVDGDTTRTEQALVSLTLVP